MYYTGITLAIDTRPQRTKAVSGYYVKVKTPMNEWIEWS